MNHGPRAAYVHVPFCRHRCGYCNFTLIAGRDDLATAYLDAVELELRMLGEPQPVETIFIGGGTPTHLSEPHLARLLELVAEWFPSRAEYEWSVEANPRDVTESKLSRLVAAGVNRISLGVQSFAAAKLRKLERDHDERVADAAITLARQHIPSVSLDLIFGAPGESDQAWSADVARAVTSGVDHISCYGLTIERGTAFWSRRQRGDLTEVDEATSATMYERAIDTLVDAGFDHYEVSNFARPGHRCRHNEVYWSGDSYCGVGPGAARYVDGVRSTNHRSTTTYLKRMFAQRSPLEASEQLEPEARARELLVFGLRRLAGVDRGWFHERTGLDLDQLAGKAICRFVDLGLIVDDGSNVRLTRRGLLVSDSMWGELL